jgi:hypothetical protein
MKTIISALMIGGLIGYMTWTWGKNQTEPVIEDPRITKVIEDWKHDLDSVGLDSETLIRRVDYIKLVKQIPNDPDTLVVGNASWTTRTIYILDRSYEPEYLKALVYHELGHYLFNLDHRDKGMIMSAELLEEPGYYKQNWSRLLPVYLEKCKNAR